MAGRGNTRSDGLTWWGKLAALAAGAGLGAVFSRWTVVLGITALLLVGIVVDELRRRR